MGARRGTGTASQLIVQMRLRCTPIRDDSASMDYKGSGELDELYNNALMIKDDFGVKGFDRYRK